MSPNNSSIDPGCFSYHQFSRRKLLASTAVASAIFNPWTALAETMALSQESQGADSKFAKSLIIVWLQGGPSQLETFDPQAGTKIGGDVKAISTSLKDIKIADSLPHVAEQMHLTTLIRSMVSKEGDHERATSNFKTGWRPDPTLEHPAIGAILAHKSNPSLDLPQHISIVPSQWPSRGGFLGPQLDAFTMGDPSQPLPNLVSSVEKDRRVRRLNLMSDVVDVEFRRGRLKDLESSRLQQSTSTDSAIRMMDTEQLAAFDTNMETSDVRDGFGNTPFGRGCLAAVRLVQQGVRCVEVELNGWDSHIDNHELQYARAAELDAALSSMLKALDARGLLDSTVVLCSGEFGRTPSINVAGGRDHWPTGFSTLLAGGPFRRGHVHGITNPEPTNDYKQTDKLVTDPVTIPDLHASVLHACGIDPATEMITPIGRPIKWSEGTIQKELFSS